MTLAPETSLLNSVSELIKEYAEKEKSRGDSFNIFSVLGFETKEDRTHSAFIAELLSPKGSHLMGSVFLELFLEQINAADYLGLDGIQVQREAYVGRVNLEDKTGGKIDVLIKDRNNRSISIENKIYALDQPHQIERYLNYNEGKNRVLYLTLNGDDPSKGSRGDKKKDEDYSCISYRDDILSWLEKCQEKAPMHSTLHGSIRQYIVLIKKLTGQFMDDKMNQDLFNLISGDYDSALLISKNIATVEQHAVRNLLVKIKEKVETEKYKHNALIYAKIDDDLSEKDEGLSVYITGYEDVLRIDLVGDRAIWNTKLNYGVCCPYDEGLSEFQKEVFNKIHNSKLFACYNDIKQNSLENDSEYPWWRYIPNMNFGDEDIRKRLFDQSAVEIMASEISNLLIELINLLHQANVFK